jgi:adenylate cyclase
MGTEIERKFLVTGETWRSAPGTRTTQGYLSRDPNRTVRVRIAGDHAWLTIKGRTTGATRAEFEYEIPLDDARALLALCDTPIIDKIRRKISHDGHLWEVDEFIGENQGLIIAEIELDSESQPFTRPPWLGLEVTGDARYYNANLCQNPFSNWN